MSAISTTAAGTGWIAVEPDGRVHLLAAACIALRLDATACTTCRDACPATCIEVAAGKFVVGERCIGCGHCAAACPTGALAVKGFADLRPIPGPDAVRVECLKVPATLAGKHAVRVPCLGGLSKAQWIDLVAAAGDRPLVAVDRGWCGQCEVAALTGSEHPARAALDQVAQLAAAAGLPADRLPHMESIPLPQTLVPPHIPGDAPAAPSRRGFFLRIGNEARRAVGKDVPAIPAPHTLRVQRMPLPARDRLLATLQRLTTGTGRPVPAAAFHTIEISSACANHGICAGICPTQALTRYEEEKDNGGRAGVAFDAVRCIGCARCSAACPEHALTLRPAGTAPATGQPVPLTAYPRHVCRECLQPWFNATDSTDDGRCPTCRRKQDMGASLFGRP